MSGGVGGIGRYRRYGEVAGSVDNSHLRRSESQGLCRPPLALFESEQTEQIPAAAWARTGSRMLNLLYKTRVPRIQKVVFIIFCALDTRIDSSFCACQMVYMAIALSTSLQILIYIGVGTHLMAALSGVVREAYQQQDACVREESGG